MYLSETIKKFDTVQIILILISIFLLTNSVLGAPADSVIVKAKHHEIKANSIYQVYFSIGQEIPPKATIVVTFPDKFDLSGVLIAGSTTINGGFHVSHEGSKVILKRSGLGRTIKPYEKVDVKFANVRNPELPADNYKITVEIKDENGMNLIQKDNIIKIK